MHLPREHFGEGTPAPDDHAVSAAGPAKPDPRSVAQSQPRLYKPGHGELQLETVEAYRSWDASRNQWLRLRITYPSAGGPYPLVVFSHGASGSKDAYQPLIRYWAAHGYVCVQPTHGDSLSLISAEDRRLYRSLTEYIASPKVRGQWRARAEDVRALLDRLPEIETAASGLAGKLDASRIGMAGHSFGAHTTQMIAGLSVRLPDGQRVTIADPRPRAFVMLSPAGQGEAIDTESWGAMTRPVLVATGSNDSSRKGLSYTWRIDVFERIPAAEKYLLFLRDGHHDFGGISGARYPWAGPVSPQHVAYVKSATLAFWDAQLKADPEALRFLRTDALQQASGGVATLRAVVTPEAS